MKSFVSGCLLIAASALVAGCHTSESTAPATVQTAQARIVESRMEQIPVTVNATGTVHAHESTVVSAQMMGRVTQVLVREGDTVRAGQTLAVLDDATQRTAVDQAVAGVQAADRQQAAAQSQADLAASTLARYKKLQMEKSVSPQEMDEVSRRAQAATAQLEAVQAQVNAASAQATAARTMLGYARVRAPFAGVVTARMADPGVLASPGVPLVQVDSAGPLQLQVPVDETQIASVRKGMKIGIVIDGAPAVTSGTVAEIVPAADPASHSFLVKINLPASSGLRAGMYGTAMVATGEKQAILAPRSAVVVRGSLNCVYALDANGTAQLRSVTLGSVHGDMVEVLSGISPQEKLVDQPGDRDLAGKRIVEDRAEVQP